MNYKQNELGGHPTPENCEININLHQDSIFTQLLANELSIDCEYFHLLLSNLSDTIINGKSVTNPNFYSKQFQKLIKLTLKENNNDLIRSDIINLIFKLLYFGGFNLFSFLIDKKLLKQYFKLLLIDISNPAIKTFLTENFQISKEQQLLIITCSPLQTNVMRLLSFISNSEIIIPFLIDKVNFIINFILCSINNDRKNKNFLLFASSFLFPFVKFISESELNINSTLIELLIDSKLQEIKLLGLQLFQRYLLFYFQYNQDSDPHVFDLLAKTIPRFLNDQYSNDIISITIKIYDTIFTTDIQLTLNFPFGDVLINLLSHTSFAVRLSALSCLSSAIAHSYPVELNPELINKLLMLFSAENSNLKVQEEVASVLSTIIESTDLSIIAQMPIPNILQVFIHIFESGNSSIYKSMFRAVYIICNVVQQFSLPIDIINPLLTFDFNDIYESYPVQLDLIHSFLLEIQERSETSS